MDVQRYALSDQGRHHRNLLRRQFAGKCMLLANGRVGPAGRPVELGHDGRAVLDPDLIHPVLVAVERQYPAVAAKPNRLDRIQDGFRRELGIRGLVVHCSILQGTTQALPWANHAVRMPRMRFPRPKSLSGLMLIGFTIVAAPLLFAIVNAAVQMNRLSARSEQLVLHGVRGTRNNQRMFEEIGALERTARLYQIIGSADLLDVYARTQVRLVGTLDELLALPLDTGSRNDAVALRAEADRMQEE